MGGCVVVGIIAVPHGIPGQGVFCAVCKFALVDGNGGGNDGGAGGGKGWDIVGGRVG